MQSTIEFRPCEPERADQLVGRAVGLGSRVVCGVRPHLQEARLVAGLHIELQRNTRRGSASCYATPNADASTTRCIE